MKQNETERITNGNFYRWSETEWNETERNETEWINHMWDFFRIETEPNETEGQPDVFFSKFDKTEWI